MSELGQFFTEHPVLKQYIKNLSKNKDDLSKKYLEPSCGAGDLLNLFDNPITAVEIDKNIKNLTDKQILYQDFMFYSLENKFDTIYGNPPYLKYDKKWVFDTCYSSCNMYVYFIEKAFRHLNHKGEIIFVVPRDFLNNTRVGRFREYLLKHGSITDIIDFQEHKMFSKSHPHIIIFRYEKGNLEHKTKYTFYQEETMNCKTFIYNNIYYFFKKVPEHLLSNYFSIKVGLVSGANQIFEHNGLIEQDTINIICSDYFNTKTKKKYYLTENQEHPVLKIYKDKLINRKIREFGEHNWHEWGAIRNINFMKEMKGTPCIFVNCKTRKKNPFFIDKVDYFDGSMLCLIPTQNLNLEHWRDILNNNDKLFKIQGMLVGKRYSFTQKTLSNFRF
tara:strand:+ start:404 stop:1567 length:1164 start_codon:yes stop_codon:yes gene_type:complete